VEGFGEFEAEASFELAFPALALLLLDWD